MSKNSFIFVVCGAKEHIDTLHFSLKYLQKYSKNEIWVLTDSSRNETPVLHDKIVDVQTPQEYNHHQASIFLKTGIFNYFPKGNRYCYLDTDIIACSEEVDAIFDQYQAPITFAPDHCTMEQFSAYAVNCDCIKTYNHYTDLLENHLVKIDPLRTSTQPMIVENRKKLVAYYQKHTSVFQKIQLGLRFLLSFKQFKISDGLYFDKKERVWKDANAQVFMNHFRWPSVSKKVGLKWNYIKGYPILPDGRSLWQLSCTHLPQYIHEKFNTTVQNNRFQHWNGGVFLFDDQSHDFLNTWFEKTMEIFKDPKWKTRDQGTLIATIWKKGLQHHPMLSKKWNLIADFHNPHLKWVNNEIQLAENERYQPAFVHVYHHFGDEHWNFWNELIEKVNR
ncbi:MAG TPA: hypothetical protein PKN22_10835 [Taishania sp.]|nr:hypothetical protein [Taishania sp.]